MRDEKPGTTARRVARRTLLGGAGVVALAGCAPVGSLLPGGKTKATVGAVDRLVAAITERDRAAFLEAFAPNPGVLSAAELLWRNLAALGSVKATAQSHGIEFAWSAATESNPARHVVSATVEGGRIAGLEPVEGWSLWWRYPVQVSTGRSVAVVHLPGDPVAKSWLKAAEDARQRVLKAKLNELAADWDSWFIVELPPDYASFTLMTNAHQALEKIAAVTRMQSRASAPRIIINPQATASMNAQESVDLLAHEGVHAATRSPVMDAPMWATEGLAEVIGSVPNGPHYRQNRDIVRAAARRGPVNLPRDADFDGDVTTLGTAYALASVAVAGCLRVYGRAKFQGWLADWQGSDKPSDEEFTRVLRDEVARQR